MNEIKQPKKPLIYYYLIALVCLLLFNALAMPWLAERQIKKVDYNTFISMTEEKNIGQVSISNEDNTITFTDKDNKVYKTAMVNDQDLTKRLYDSGASFSGEEIRQMSPLLSIFLTWILPLVIFIGIGQLMSRKLMERAGGKNSMMFGMGKSNAKIYVKSSKGIKFDDVAGEDEAKENLAEIVESISTTRSGIKRSALPCRKGSCW